MQRSRESACHPAAHWDRNSNKAVTPLDEQKENIQNLGTMLARIQIIKSDFDVVAQVSPRIITIGV